MVTDTVLVTQATVVPVDHVVVAVAWLPVVTQPVHCPVELQRPLLPPVIRQLPSHPFRQFRPTDARLPRDDATRRHKPRVVTNAGAEKWGR